jgi:hypothetical protein
MLSSSVVTLSQSTSEIYRIYWPELDLVSEQQQQQPLQQDSGAGIEMMPLQLLQTAQPCSVPMDVNVGIGNHLNE